MEVFKELLVLLRLGETRNASYDGIVNPDGQDPPTAFLFICCGLAVGGILRAIVKVLNCPIPFRVLILFTGCIVGFISRAVPEMETYIKIVHVKPRYLLMAFLPLLVFKTAFCIDAHTFMRSWSQILFLAVPGLLISACFTGILMMVILGHDDWTYAMGILFGAICSPIYPVEIVTLLKGMGQAKHLAILLEGEGMVGDSTVMILFEILTGVIDDNIVDWLRIFILFIRFAVGGILWGLVCGKVMTWIMAALYNDVVNMLISTIAAAYLTYYIGVEVLTVSGVIAVVVLGIMASMEKTSLSLDVEIFLLHFWDMLAYIANTMVFLFAGVIIAERWGENTTVQDYTLVLVTYVVVGVSRLISYILMAPIVSRIGYGLTFRYMTIAVWSGVRGPVPFCLTLSVFHHVGLSMLGSELLVHVTGLVTLTLLINATTTPLLLRLLGLSELSMARKANMNNCMRHLQNRRDRTISMLKMDRFLADANWPLVNTATILKHPYKINFSDNDDEEENYLGFRVTTCPDCLKEIPNEPTTKELVEMTREARMRILKAKKISYSRQYENGMLSKEGIRVLTQAVETAMDTEDALIELEGLHKCFKRQGFIHYTRRKLLAVFFKKSENTVKPPRKYWRRICYHIVMHPGFDIFIYSCIVLNVIPIGLEIGKMPRSGTALSTGLKIANTIFFLIYLFEFILKIYGYSWIYVCQHGFRTYFGSYWNIFDFIILCVALVDLVMDYVDLFSKTFNKVNHKASRVTLFTKLIRVIRLIRLLRLCKAWYPKLIKYCDSKIDKHLAFAYDVGKGFVTGEEEVSDMLIQMIDNKTIREDCRLRMEADRLAVTKELGMVQKDRPWIAITVKTRQAIRSTLNSMGEAILELKVSGWVDDVEYGMLMESLEERLKYVRTKVKSVQPSPPKVMFKEVPWMADDEQIADFLYENVVTKVFDQGEVVCTDGEMSDGVFIIVTGLFKLSYTPRKEIIDALVDYGALPILDYISSTRFDEKVEDYIVSGNCVGELSALTGRPYNCTITADTASQAYILTHDVLRQATQKSPDPVSGLESKMWKSISIRLATSILMDTPAYQSSTQEKIRFQLERAFVPNLSNYKVFGVNDMMEDIMLIEGVVFDYNTRDCYTAPCYIPRTVQKIVLPKSSHMDFETTVETRLLIIPAKDVDEFDIMDREEDISELVSTCSDTQHIIQNRSSRLRRRRKRQTTFSMGGGRRVKYGESRISATQSVYYSRSRTTNASLLETELQNININDRVSLAGASNIVDSYVVNEKENRNSTQDRRISRGLSAALERRVSSRRASSIVPKRPYQDDDRRLSRLHNRFNSDQPDTNRKAEDSSAPEKVKGEKRISYDRKSEEEQRNVKENISDSKRKQSEDSKLPIPENTENISAKTSPSLLKKSGKTTNVENQPSERTNSLTAKDKYRKPSTDVKSLNEQENLKQRDQKQPFTLTELLQSKRRSSSLKKLQDNSVSKDRQTSDDIEKIEVEQRSQIFGSLKGDELSKRKSSNSPSLVKRQSLFSDDETNARPQADNRKAVKDYSDRSKVESEIKEANGVSSSQSDNYSMTQQRKSKDSDVRDDLGLEASYRRKSTVVSPKLFESQATPELATIYDDSKSIDEISISKPDYSYRKTSNNEENPYNTKQQRKSDVGEARLSLSPETSYRPKSITEFLKKTDNVDNIGEAKQRHESDSTETVQSPAMEFSNRRKSVIQKFDIPEDEDSNDGKSRKSLDDNEVRRNSKTKDSYQKTDQKAKTFGDVDNDDIKSQRKSNASENRESLAESFDKQEPDIKKPQPQRNDAKSKRKSETSERSRRLTAESAKRQKSVSESLKSGSSGYTDERKQSTSRHPKSSIEKDNIELNNRKTFDVDSSADQSSLVQLRKGSTKSDLRDDKMLTENETENYPISRDNWQQRKSNIDPIDETDEQGFEQDMKSRKQSKGSDVEDNKDDNV